MQMLTISHAELAANTGVVAAMSSTPPSGGQSIVCNHSLQMQAHDHGWNYGEMQ